MNTWEEIEQAKANNRHELVICGDSLNKRLKETNGVIDPELFALEQLNFLSLNTSQIYSIPKSIGKLQNLTNLTLLKNQIEEIPMEIGSLKKLKYLDCSGNKFKTLPEELFHITTLANVNISNNNIDILPSFHMCSSLSHLNAANNKLKEFPDIAYKELKFLSEIDLSYNEIEEMSCQIHDLSALKTLDLRNNKIKTVPGQINKCPKLKKLSLEENPLRDTRFKNLVNSSRCTSKQVLEYINKNVKVSSQENGKASEKSKKKKKKSVNDELNDLLDEIKVMSLTEESVVIHITDEAVLVRPYIVCCIVHEVDLTDARFKKFLALQTKLHDSLCEKRTVATIATHDLNSVASPLSFTAILADTIKLTPLLKTKKTTALEYFEDLSKEAEANRKQNKRNTYSGIHKFLYLLKDWEKWPCLIDAKDIVISLPPLTNADETKISPKTTSILIEVTSSSSLPRCKEIMEYLLKQMLNEFTSCVNDAGQKLLKVSPVRILHNSKLKLVFPSRTDLNLEGIIVTR